MQSRYDLDFWKEHDERRKTTSKSWGVSPLEKIKNSIFHFCLFNLQGTLTRCKSQFFIIFTWKDSRGQYKVLIKKIRCQWAFYDHIIKIEKIIKKCKKLQKNFDPRRTRTLHTISIACNKTTTLWLHISLKFLCVLMIFLIFLCFKTKVCIFFHFLISYCWFSTESSMNFISLALLCFPLASSRSTKNCVFCMPHISKSISQILKRRIAYPAHLMWGKI